jgi:hypothetical protein
LNRPTCAGAGAEISLSASLHSALVCSSGVDRFVIEIDDPRRDDVRSLLEQHLGFARAVTPPEDVHALDLDGLLDSPGAMTEAGVLARCTRARCEQPPPRT